MHTVLLRVQRKLFDHFEKLRPFLTLDPLATWLIMNKKCVVKTYFSTKPSIRLVETDFLSSRNSMLLFKAFFQLLKTMIEIRESQF